MKKKRVLTNRLIDFDLSEDRFMMMQFSEDFKDSMERYLLHGLDPGGFTAAMLACDFERALYNADTHNRRVFWAIAMWIRQRLPGAAWGSYEAVAAWCQDQGGCRSEFVQEYEKEQTWLTLVK